MSSLFVSDLHLSGRRPATAGLFLRFLAGPAAGCTSLYILGDLFDYWAGDDDQDDPFNRQICAALAACPAAKYFLPGNRDFLAGDEFLAATGMTPLPDLCVRTIAGRPTLLLHGDTLCTDDTDYQAFRDTVRSAQWRKEFLGLPLAERRRQIERLRERSETEKQGKAHELMDVNGEAVAEAFRRHGADRMIHGHTHRQAAHELTIDGRACQRWVLGEWTATGNALACEDNACGWLTLNP
jgi:UDP-2,3-diacylglucosamine hydrolase